MRPPAEIHTYRSARMTSFKTDESNGAPTRADRTGLIANKNHKTCHELADRAELRGSGRGKGQRRRHDATGADHDEQDAGPWRRKAQCDDSEQQQSGANGPHRLGDQSEPVRWTKPAWEGERAIRT